MTSAREQKSELARLGLQGVRTSGRPSLSRQATIRPTAVIDAESGISIRLIDRAVTGPEMTSAQNGQGAPTLCTAEEAAEILRVEPAATIGLMTGARVRGISSDEASDLAGRGEFPCDVIETGDGYRVPFVALLGVLDRGPVRDDGQDATP